MMEGKAKRIGISIDEMIQRDAEWLCRKQNQDKEK